MSTAEGVSPAGEYTGALALTMTERIGCRFCYCLVINWPFSSYNRIAWPIYLWLMQYAGIRAEELLGREIDEADLPNGH